MLVMPVSCSPFKAVLETVLWIALFRDAMVLFLSNFSLPIEYMKFRPIPVYKEGITGWVPYILSAKLLKTMSCEHLYLMMQHP